MDTEQNSNRRFGGIERLYGTPAWHKLQQAHVTVVGVGGAGSYETASVLANLRYSQLHAP